MYLVEGGTNGPKYVNMALMGKTSLGRVTHARKRQKTLFTNLETHGDGSGYLACDTCSSGVPKEVVPAGIVPIGNILVGNNLGVQTRTKGYAKRVVFKTNFAVIWAQKEAVQASDRVQHTLNGDERCLFII